MQYNSASFLGTVLAILVGSLSANGSRDLPPEWHGLGAVTNAILSYAEEHDGRLPKSLGDLDETRVTLRRDITLDMYIYVAPKGATMDFPPDTPLVLFPWDTGVIVGYMNGYRRFQPGGHSEKSPARLLDRLYRWRIAFGVSVFGNLLLIYLWGSRVRKEKVTLINLVTVVVIFGILVSVVYPMLPKIDDSRSMVIRAAQRGF